MKKLDYIGFLHCHPMKENEMNLDSNHVIVDREDWEAIRNKLNLYECLIDYEKLWEELKKDFTEMANGVNGVYESILDDMERREQEAAMEPKPFDLEEGGK